MSWVLLAIQIAPYVLAIIEAVEKIFGAGQGGSKKALVLAIIKAILSAKPKGPADVESIYAGLIDTTVAEFNTAGVFAKPTAV